MLRRCPCVDATTANRCHHPLWTTPRALPRNDRAALVSAHSRTARGRLRNVLARERLKAALAHRETLQSKQISAAASRVEQNENVLLSTPPKTERAPARASASPKRTNIFPPQRPLRRSGLTMRITLTMPTDYLGVSPFMSVPVTSPCCTNTAPRSPTALGYRHARRRATGCLRLSSFVPDSPERFHT